MTDPTPTPTPTLPLTAAQQFLADNRLMLEEDLADRKTLITSLAGPLSKDDLRVALDRYNEVADPYARVAVPAKSASKSDYVTAFVAAKIKGTDEQKALNDALVAAHADERLDWAMQSLRTDRDRALAKVTEALAVAATDPAKAGSDLLYHMEWHADDNMTTLAAARLADGYFDARARGVEPSAYAAHLAKQAIAKIVRAVDGGSNLRLTSRGLHDLCEANAHRIVLSKVLGHLDQATQDLIGYVL